MVFKVCVVPCCNNNSENAADKLFLTVPKSLVRRKRWAEAIKLDCIPFDGKYCICEDHFNLSEDSSNWLYYTMIGTANLLLNPEVVPHRYVNSRPEINLYSQVHEARKRKLTEVYDESTSTSKMVKATFQEDIGIENIPVDVSVVGISSSAVKFKKNVSTQASIKKPSRNAKTNTAIKETRTSGTLTTVSFPARPVTKY